MVDRVLCANKAGHCRNLSFEHFVFLTPEIVPPIQAQAVQERSAVKDKPRDLCADGLACANSGFIYAGKRHTVYAVPRNSWRWIVRSHKLALEEKM